MINKIIAIQGNHPSKLNPLTDTSIFLANEIQKKNMLFFNTVLVVFSQGGLLEKTTIIYFEKAAKPMLFHKNCF